MQGEKNLISYNVWTNQEKKKIQEFIQRKYPNGQLINWQRVAELLPSRTPQQCKSCYQQLKIKQKKQNFQQYSSNQLQEIVSTLKEVALNLDISSDTNNEKQADGIYTIKDEVVQLSNGSVNEKFHFQNLNKQEVNFFDNYEKIDPEFALLSRYKRHRILQYCNYYDENYDFLCNIFFTEFTPQKLKHFYNLQQQYNATFMLISKDIQSLNQKEIISKYTVEQLQFYYNDAQTTNFKIQAYKQATLANSNVIKLRIPSFSKQFPIYDGLLEQPVDYVKREFWLFLDRQYNYQLITTKLAKILELENN